MSKERKLYQFYINKRCGFIYKTMEDVKLALKISEMAVGEYDMESARREAEFLRPHSINLFVTENKAPIFLLEKKKEEPYLEEFWNVIIGDKVGWIYAPEWLIESLENNQ